MGGTYETCDPNTESTIILSSSEYIYIYRLEGKGMVQVLSVLCLSILMKIVVILILALILCTSSGVRDSWSGKYRVNVSMLV